MAINWPSKKASAVEPYTADWSQYLDTGDSIISSDWVIVGGATSLTITQKIAGTTSTQVWLSGGRDGATYTLKNSIRTFLGENLDESFSLDIRGD